MKKTLFVSSLLIAIAESSVQFWLTPKDHSYQETDSCGDMSGAYSDIIQLTAEQVLDADLFQLVAGVHSLQIETVALDPSTTDVVNPYETTSFLGAPSVSTTYETTTAVLEPATRRNLRGDTNQEHRELVDCGICESNPPSSIEACCILVPYWSCGICMGSGSRRRELGEEDEAQRDLALLAAVDSEPVLAEPISTTTEVLPPELRLVQQLPRLNDAIKAKLDRRCALEVTQAVPGAANCWSCDHDKKSWDGTVRSYSLI